MSKKISIASCNGMSALGLIGRVSCEDLASENEDMISICITAIAANKSGFTNIISKYPILAINGCSDSCVNKIIESKDINIEKTLYIDKILSESHAKTGDPSRLDENGERAVEKLKIAIKKELNLI
ncbi:putative zinc-binding protein [Methanobrevibacter cuticularis]|nr:putative zinc-binding protein [Methanobrevibacter cuticularis]